MSSEGRAQVNASGQSTVPTGTVTFLFTDIEGSTRRWEANAEAMKVAVARHEQILNESVARHGGYVFKLMGDAFCVAFQSAADAVSAACDAQRVLSTEDFSTVDGLSVRMGVHTGTAEERNADYFGPTVNRVARLMSIGHGGQVLISGATRDSAHQSLPSGATLADLGLRRLKDLTQPEQVWQVALAGLRNEFPPLNSLDARGNNLPMQPTTLIGRADDIEEVKTLVGEQRLLTLSGSGGVGKTRLALQVGAELLDRFADGVWFADLAPIRDPELVASVIAKSVGVSSSAGQPLVEAIPEGLSNKQLLVILDNCEHVLDAAAPIASSIVTRCPNVKMIATSRQALGIAGEAVHRLRSLSVPEVVGALKADDAARYGSVALFVERARAVDTRFSMTDETAPIVADICRRLDGIPLAIELAAARVRVLSIPNLARRLDERFKVLTGGNRTALPRQKTLGALIDWSFDLLPSAEQTLFARLGIFAGRFGLDAATVICGGNGVNENEVLDLLSSLTDKSLVVADTSATRESFRLLETTRAYALDKLTAVGERDAIARGHGEYFRAFARSADIRRSSGLLADWFAVVEPEVENFRATLEWALKEGHDPVLGSDLVALLDELWRNRGLMAEARYWIGLAQAGLDESGHPKIAARLWRLLGWITSSTQNHLYAERALALYESTGDKLGVARCLHPIAMHALYGGRLDEAAALNERAIALHREVGDMIGVASGLGSRGIIQLKRGDVTAARDTYMEVMTISKKLGNEPMVGRMLTRIAEIEFQDGKYEDALRFASEASEIYLRGKTAVFSALGACFLAAIQIALGELDKAAEFAREGLAMWKQVEDRLQMTFPLESLALISAMRGNHRTAALLVGYVDAQRTGVGYEGDDYEVWVQERLSAAVRERFSEAEIERLGVEGAVLTEDQVAEAAASI